MQMNCLRRNEHHIYVQIEMNEQEKKKAMSLDQLIDFFHECIIGIVS